jgi:hypothetical protein
MGDHISLFRFVLAPSLLGVCQLRCKEELRASLAKSRRGIRLFYQAIVNLRWRRSHNVINKI